MRKNIQKAAGSHFGMPIWLISMTKPPETIDHFHNKQLKEILID